jgi:DNA repair protein RadD
MELAGKIPNSAPLYSGMSAKERNQIVGDFKSGKIRVILQVNILTVGFDHPELDCIITGRPTASLSWWYQFVGRVTRIHDLKKDGLVIDFVGSVPKFGKVEDLYFKYDAPQWKLYGEGKKLLTGIPLHEIGLHIEGETTPQEKAAEGEPVIYKFGKYNGTKIKDSPRWYRDWLLENFNFGNVFQNAKDEMLRLKNIGI